MSRTQARLRPWTPRPRPSLVAQIAEQMVLSLGLRRQWTPERFVGNSLRDLLASSESLHWIYGPKSAGKSHLLVALCQQAEREDRPSIYIDLACTETSDAISAIHNIEVIALDNVDQVLDDPDWALALYGLINSLYQQGHRVRSYWSALRPATDLRFATEDLASRCRAMLPHSLSQHDDHQKLEILRRIAEDEGFQLPASAARYLIERSARDLGALADVMHQIALVSLREKRKVTLPLVRQVMAGQE